MAKPGVNLQDSFLNQVRKDNSEITLVLLDGTQLRGHVRGFDNFTVIIHAEGQQHLIYKHAIAQIVAQRFLNTEQERETPRPETHRPHPPQPAARAGELPRESPREARREAPREHREQREPRDSRDQARENPKESQGEKAREKFNALDLSSLRQQNDGQSPS